MSNALRELTYYLQNLNEAIILSHFEISSPTLLTSKTITEITSTLNKLYNKDQILIFKHPYSFFQLIKTQIVVSNDALIIVIFVPLFYEDTYHYFQLIPLPYHSKILIPPQPYLLLSQKEEIWTSEECPTIESTRVCLHTKKDPLSTEEKCFAPIIRRQPQHGCQYHWVSVPKPEIKIIQNQYILIIPADNSTLLIFEQCPPLNQLNPLSISSPTEILPGKCRYKVNNDWISLNTFDLGIQPHHFPKLELTNSTNFNVSYKSLQKLNDQIDLLQPIHIQDFSSISPTTNWWFWILLAIIILLLLVYLFWKCRSKIRRQTIPISIKMSSLGSPTNKANHPKEDDLPHSPAHPKNPF